MPIKEISLPEIKSILTSSGISTDQNSKIEEIVNRITDYLKNLISPIQIKSTTPNTSATPNSPIKARNPKEESIINVYRIVLGREPSVNDLTYLASINISEDVLLKRMVDSLEHAEIVKARQEILSSRVEYNLMKRQFDDVNNCLKDREAILANLQNILEEKNASYEELSVKYDAIIKRLNELTKPDERENSTTMVDRILDWFNKRFG
ncbi:MAG: hypothetical protein WCO33_02365 [bacterium]